MDFESFRHRYPHELSGGQQQRIGVARGLAADPSVILMDEPFSALDPISRVQLQNELMKLNQTLKKTIVFVTHDIDEALKIADILVLLKDGKIVQIATPEELLDKPANDFVRTFVGEDRFRNSTVPMQTFQMNHASVPQPLSIGSSELLTTAVDRMRHFSEEVLVVTDKNFCYLGVVYLTDANVALKEGTEVTIEGALRRDYPVVTEMTSAGEIFRLLTNHSLVPVIDKHHRLIRVLAREGVLNVLTNHTKRAEKYGISTTSELAEQSDKFVFGSAQEFLNRPDGYPAIEKTYNMKFKEVKSFGAQLDYQALSQKQVDSIIVYTTDGRIPENNIKVLEDDKHLFLPYDAVPLVKDEVLKKYPELKDVLNKLAGKISDNQMQQLNYEVDIKKAKAEDVAKKFLTEQGLLK